MDNQLKARRTWTVTQHPCTSINSYGDKTFDVPIDHLCYQQGKVTMHRNAAGEEVTATLRLIFDGHIPVTRRDEFDFNGTTYPVVSTDFFDAPKPMTGTTVVYL